MEEGLPTFKYILGEQEITERFQPVAAEHSIVLFSPSPSSLGTQASAP
jgi:hypothetical protein